jgi:hypothetical protein
MTWSRDAAGGAKRRSGRETSRQHVRGRKRPATFKIEWPPVEDARPGSRHPALANSGGMPAGARAAPSGAWAARTGFVSAVAARDGVVALDALMCARRNVESPPWQRRRRSELCSASGGRRPCHGASRGDENQLPAAPRITDAKVRAMRVPNQ